jgi:hypothetical protein
MIMQKKENTDDNSHNQSIKDIGFWNLCKQPSIFARCCKTIEYKDIITTPLLYSMTTEFEVKRVNDMNMALHVSQFLHTFFGSPPKTPYLYIEPTQLIYNPSKPVHHVKTLYITSSTKNPQIIGCVRDTFAGYIWTNTIKRRVPVYCIDCFCVHPEYRKTGVGHELLHNWHYDSDKEGIHTVIFLKEGAPLPITALPFYSSRYAYINVRKMKQELTNNSMLRNETNWKYISVHDAEHKIQTYKKIFPDTFVIFNATSTIKRSFLEYKKDTYWALLCIQDSHQIHPEDKGIIGLQTCFLPSPNLINGSSNDEFNLCMKELIHNIHFDWFWTDQQWISKSDLKWKKDGPFHWYSFQWFTNKKIGPYYCMTY